MRNTEEKADAALRKVPLRRGMDKKADGERPAGKAGKRLKCILGAAILTATILILNYFAGLCFSPPTDWNYYNYDIRRMDQENVPVDMIIVGASQVYRGCNVDVLSDKLGIGEVVNCAAALGYADGLYYMLRDLLRRFEPKCVVIDMSWHRFRENTDPTARYGMYVCADRLDWPDRLDYAFHCYELEDWPNFSPFYRYGKSVWSLSRLKRNYLSRKAVDEGRRDATPWTNYQKNGYSWSEKSCPQGSIPAQDDCYSNDQVSEYIKKYITKMRTLCEEKNIPLIFMTMPRSLMEVYGVGNYQESVDYITAYAEKLGCEYLNFAYLRNREEIFPDPLFTDKVHLNRDGSVVFSEILADAVKKTLNGEDTDSLFYENLDELKKDVHRIVACNGRILPNGDGTLTVEARSFQNEDVVPEYRLLLIDAPDTAGSDRDGSDDADDGGDSSEEGSSESGDAPAGAAQNRSDMQELCPWQEEATFLIREEEIPKGRCLRLEVRRKGETQADAYVNALKGEFQINRVR